MGEERYNSYTVMENNQTYKLTEDGSILDKNDRVVFFSVERFISDICMGNCCFICGAKPSETQFNDEHVLPEWILRKYSLFSKTINLPNETLYKYAQYKIPCCADCNSLMGRVFEKPIREMTEKGYQEFVNYISKHGFSFLLQWLAIIFLKTHLKDKQLRSKLDIRKGGGKISDDYDWEELHHIHCVARSFYTKCELDPKIQGTLVILPAKVSNEFEQFDYLDLYMAKTMLLRLDDIAIVHVLNDSCAVINLHRDVLKKISRPLSHLQLRELTATFAYSNLDLKERPDFYSNFNHNSATCRIEANLPERFEFDEFDTDIYGSIMIHCFKDYLNLLPQPDKGSVESYMRKGRYSFLFDEAGNLINNYVIYMGTQQFFKTTSSWGSTFPNSLVGILVMRNASNPAHHSELEKRKTELEEHLRAQFAGQDRAAIASHPVLQVYGEYYKRFKKTYHVQLQLESIVLKGKSIPSVALLVEGHVHG